ncbi:MAG: hypothetical protein EHM79_15835 [Geobacter sp.]|nr:MAG: hypothetical protein EHM79_15835 [Geobacter sp.]
MGNDPGYPPETIQVSRPHHNSKGGIAVRPGDTLNSLKPLESSILNSFTDIIWVIIDKGILYEIHIRVQDMAFKSLVTKRAAIDLGPDINACVQISFKSSAVHIL